MTSKVLSAIQPTGDMHLGNYFGATSNWVKLQEKYICNFGIVDYHAMTTQFDPAKLRTNTWNMAINLMAIGVKPENLFIQSLIPEHAELCWIFNCFASYTLVERQPQFKGKSSIREGFTVGLFDYPVLQAADILIYKADKIPVGEDQDSHIELTRHIARRFNILAGQEYFVLPKALKTAAPKIRSTANPQAKMSKSAGQKHYISLFDDEAVIRKKIKSAVTDDPNTPSGIMPVGVENLITILAASGSKDVATSFEQDFINGSLRYSDLKNEVALAIIDLVAPFNEKKKEILAKKKVIKNQIKESSAEIRKTAQQTMGEVKEITGLLNVKY